MSKHKHKQYSNLLSIFLAAIILLSPVIVVVYRVIHLNGWHPCPDDSGVWCKGFYAVNLTIVNNQVVHAQRIG